MGLGDEPDFADLVARAAANDEAAWQALIARFGGVIWSMARAHGLAWYDAADVEQMVWLRLVENVSRLREPRRIRSWLLTTARNECYRMHAANRRLYPAETYAIDRPDPRSPELIALAAESARAMLRVLNQLPHPCGLLLRLRFRDPAPDEDTVADFTGVPRADLASTRRRCLRQFRRRLEALGGA